MRKKVVKNAQCAEKSYMRAFYAKQKINLSCTQDTIFRYYSVHKKHFTCKDFCLLKMIFFQENIIPKQNAKKSLKSLQKKSL